MPINGGTYKISDNHVLKADGSIHYYTLAVAVSGEMEKLISWSEANYKNLHPIELAANIHFEITRIHQKTIDVILNILEGKGSSTQNKHPLYFIRKEKKLSQKMLSILSEVVQATISKIENRKEIPQNQTLKALANALKIDLKKLR